MTTPVEQVLVYLNSCTGLKQVQPLVATMGDALTVGVRVKARFDGRYCRNSNSRMRCVHRLIVVDSGSCTGSILVLSQQQVDRGIAQTVVVDPVATAQFYFQAKPGANCHPATAVPGLIAVDISSPGVDVAERHGREFPDHLGDIPLALHRRATPIADLEAGHAPVARMEPGTEHEPPVVPEEGMDGEISPRLEAGQCSLKDDLRVFQGLELGRPIHPRHPHLLLHTLSDMPSILNLSLAYLGNLVTKSLRDLFDELVHIREIRLKDLQQCRANLRC